MRRPGGVGRLRRPVAWGGIAWLTVVWVLLWGTLTPLTLLGGMLVAVAVSVLFGAPGSRVPVRPLRLLGLLGFLVHDLVASATEVSWQTLRYGPAARGAILAVPLLGTSERAVALIAGAYSFSPGTLVLEIDLGGGVWYIYALGPRDHAGAERARRRALEVQRRVLMALGSPAEVAAVREAP